MWQKWQNIDFNFKLPFHGFKKTWRSFSFPLTNLFLYIKFPVNIHKFQVTNHFSSTPLAIPLTISEAPPHHHTTTLALAISQLKVDDRPPVCFWINRFVQLILLILDRILFLLRVIHLLKSANLYRILTFATPVASRLKCNSKFSYRLFFLLLFFPLDSFPSIPK